MKYEKLFYLILLLSVFSCKKDRLVNTLPVEQGPPVLEDLKINGAVCPFDSASKTFYFPVSLGSPLATFKINFDNPMVDHINFNNKSYSNGSTVDMPLKTNDDINISAYNTDDDEIDYKLLITGLPLVQLSGNPEIGDDYEAINFSIIDPDYQTHKSDFYVTVNSGIKLRGATSRLFPKKAFALQIHDSNGNNMDTSIMGLRSDQNWILDAMYIDKAKMRNRLCTDVWNTINNVPYILKEPDAHNGTRGYLSEVFINNNYWGVYTFTEKLDRKQLQVKKKTGFVYKSDEWSNAVQFLAASPYDNSSETWDSWEVSYPDDGDDRPIDWGDLYSLVNFVSTSSDADFINGINQKIDMDNMIDYLLFVNAVAGEDNTAKNAYMSIYDTTESKQFFYSVWDLDGTMGRDWDGKYYQNESFDFLCLEGSNLNMLFQRLVALNPDNFIEKVKARWAELKANQLSTNSVDALIQHYRDLLVNTNADKRETEKWIGTINDIPTETDYMTSWYATHLQALDNYISNL